MRTDRHRDHQRSRGVEEPGLPPGPRLGAGGDLGRPMKLGHPTPVVRGSLAPSWPGGSGAAAAGLEWRAARNVYLDGVRTSAGVWLFMARKPPGQGLWRRFPVVPLSRPAVHRRDWPVPRSLSARLVGACCSAAGTEQEPAAPLSRTPQISTKPPRLPVGPQTVEDNRAPGTWAISRWAPWEHHGGAFRPGLA